MKTVFLLFASLSLSAHAAGPVHQLVKPYLGKGNHQVMLTFNGRLELHRDADKKFSDDEILEKVEAQLKYLVGVMRTQGHNASPRKNHVVKNLIVASRAIPSKESVWDVTYLYQGNAVVPVNSGPYYTIRLPLDPDQTRQLNAIECMDQTFFHAGAPTYYWCPTCKRCPLKDGRDFATSTARLTASTAAETYPDYKRLVDANGELHLYAIYPQTTATQCGDSDWGDRTYRRLYDRALADGFYAGAEAPTAKNLCHAAVIEKKTPKAKLVLHLFYGAARPWFDMGVKSGAVILYNGHSLLGHVFDNVDFAISKDRYQIYVLNGCNTYSHFLEKIFRARATSEDPTATKNLEIIANADEGSLVPTEEEEVRVYRAVLEWATGKSSASYSEILKSFPAEHMPGVVGEEDNPRSMEYE